MIKKFIQKRAHEKALKLEAELDAAYKEATDYAGGIGGYGTNIPLDRSHTFVVRVCPVCGNTYPLDTTDCTRCTEIESDMEAEADVSELDLDESDS